MKRSLRSAVIRLAAAQPRLRSKLLPWVDPMSRVAAWPPETGAPRRVDSVMYLPLDWDRSRSDEKTVGRILLDLWRSNNTKSVWVVDANRIWRAVRWADAVLEMKETLLEQLDDERDNLLAWASELEWQEDRNRDTGLSSGWTEYQSVQAKITLNSRQAAFVKSLKLVEVRPVVSPRSGFTGYLIRFNAPWGELPAR